jgi:peptide/nickel transport system substrate-binding protein
MTGRMCGVRRAAGIAALALLVGSAGFPAMAQTLKIGLNEDPDVLDPVLGRTFVGRVVFASLCDKLFDITPDLKIVPQLATAWAWSEDGKHLTLTLRDGVLFQDGEKLDAAAVKYNIERDINLPGSNRKSEFPPLDGVTVIDPLTVRIDLKDPFAPLVSVLTDRAGMMVSPKAAQAAEAAGTVFGNHPVCAGPFKLVERVAQDRIVVEKFDRYWNKDHIKLDRIIYQPLPDASVRLANLKSGDLDLIERVLPTDWAEVQANPQLGNASSPALSYQGLTINVGNSARAKTPLGSDARVRKALELSLDREAMNQVLYNGLFIADNQFVTNASPYHDSALPMPPRDVAKAKALLKAAGTPNPSFTLVVATSPIAMQIGQMIQAMAQEAGFDIKLQATEFTTALDRARHGDFEAFSLDWSGRIDPDGNSYSFLHTGGALNDGHYSTPEVDQLLDQARSASSDAARKALYDKVQAITATDLPIIYLSHAKLLWAFTKKLGGFVPTPDGIIRVTDLSKS